jgi:hypothetical protein
VVGGRLRVTPRGLYQLGPAEVYYQDMLGLTRISLASLATAELKVLPRFRPLEIREPPRSRLQSPDVITRPHRFATEDHFRFREYAAGDDTRRIHWKLSVRSGHLTIRQPETREISTKNVLLVLDTFLPAGRMLDDVAEAERPLCEELRPVVTDRAADPPGRHPSANAPRLVEHEHALTMGREPLRRHEPGDPGPDHDGIEGAFSLVHGWSRWQEWITKGHRPKAASRKVILARGRPSGGGPPVRRGATRVSLSGTH